MHERQKRKNRKERERERKMLLHQIEFLLFHIDFIDDKKISTNFVDSIWFDFVLFWMFDPSSKYRQ